MKVAVARMEKGWIDSVKEIQDLRHTITCFTKDVAHFIAKLPEEENPSLCELKEIATELKGAKERKRELDNNLQAPNGPVIVIPDSCRFNWLLTKCEKHLEELSELLYDAYNRITDTQADIETQRAKLLSDALRGENDDILYSAEAYRQLVTQESRMSVGFAELLDEVSSFIRSHTGTNRCEVC